MKFNYCIGLILFIAVASCGDEKKEQYNEAEMVVDSFATDYFNYDFKGAMKHVTRDSEKWLIYAASNVKQEDVDALRSMDEGATVAVDSSEFTGKGCIVYITVRNFLKADTIGKAGRVIKEASFRIPVSKDDGKWKIRMEGLLQSGNRSRD